MLWTPTPGSLNYPLEPHPREKICGSAHDMKGDQQGWHITHYCSRYQQDDWMN